MMIQGLELRGNSLQPTYAPGDIVSSTNPEFLQPGCRYERYKRPDPGPGKSSAAVVSFRVVCNEEAEPGDFALNPPDSSGEDDDPLAMKWGGVPVWMIVAGVGLAILMSRGGGGK